MADEYVPEYVDKKALVDRQDIEPLNYFISFCCIYDSLMVRASS